MTADRAQSFLTLDLLIRNSLPEVAQLVELRLVFYRGQKPRGGLQVYQRESATYVLIDGVDSNSLSVAEVQTQVRHQTEIKYPFAGQDYAKVSIPLSQVVSKGETDRFVVRFETKQLPKKGHHNIEATIRYNNDKLTKARTISLLE